MVSIPTFLVILLFIVAGLVFSALFSVPIILFLLRAQNRQEKLVKTAVAYITTNFPHMEIRSIKPNILPSSKIYAISTKQNAPIQKLIISEVKGNTVESPTQLLISATIIIRDYKLGDFSAKIFPQSLLNKLMTNENIILGNKVIDKKLIIEGKPQEYTKMFFMKHLDYLNLLASKRGFVRCILEKTGPILEIQQKHNRFTVKRTIQALDALRALASVRKISNSN